jgi:hypothetical protein
VEQLISFVMDNFYIVIIVLGIVYSLFFRKSPLERPPNRMPDFGGGGRPRPDQRPSSADSRSPASERQTSAPVPVEQPEWIETRQQEQMPIERGTPIHAPARADIGYVDDVLARPARSTQEKVIVQQSQKTKMRFGAEALTHDDLSRAVMWAEILGPPRARRPHRR